MGRSFADVMANGSSYDRGNKFGLGDIIAPVGDLCKRAVEAWGLDASTRVWQPAGSKERQPFCQLCLAFSFRYFLTLGRVIGKVFYPYAPTFTQALPGLGHAG